MGRLTDTQVRGIKPGQRKSEALDAGGQLVIWYRERTNSCTKEYYYRKRMAGSPELNVKLGTVGTSGLKSIASARAKANEMAEKAASVVDLKFKLAQEERDLRLQELKAKEDHLRVSNLGSLYQLILAYRDKMQSENKASALKVFKSLQRYVIQPFPALVSKAANSVTSQDIAEILRAMHDKDITTTLNRTRADLHAAFNVGMTYDYSPTLRSKDGVIFDLHKNPVARIASTKSYERALQRHLCAKELDLVWTSCEEHMNPTYASLLRIMICTGFHATELMRLNLKDVDTKAQAIYMTQTKSGTPNLIPLNKYAWREVKKLLANADSSELLFPSRVSSPNLNVYSRISVPANQVAQLRENITIDHFTPRDIRRTVKTLMGSAGISKEMRDRLQNHATSDVSTKHYDRYDYWKEKSAAASTWERWLGKNVIEHGEFSSNVVNISA